MQGTTKKLAKGVGVDYGDVSYMVAGINHQAWVLRLQQGNEDLYPKLREIVDSDEAFADDRVRVEMMKQLSLIHI